MVALIVLQPEMALKVLRGQVSGGPYGSMRPSRRRPDYSLHFNFAETAWKTGIQEPALLLERARDYRNPHDPAQSLGIIAVARVMGRMRNADGSRPIEISDWTALPQSIALHEVTKKMNPVRARLLWSSFDGVTRPLSPRLDRELREVLVALIPDYDRIVQSKRRDSQQSNLIDAEDALLDAERRDRFGTSLRMFGIVDWNRVEPSPSVAGPPVQAERFEFDLTEQDMLTDDSSTVPGWQPAGRASGGWFEFQDEGRRLLVKNINFQHAETESGGDLIYVRDHPSTILFVQYKRLKLRKGLMFYDSADRLYRQLGKLISLQAEEKLVVEGRRIAAADSYRLSPISGFVKFVETRPLKPDHNELLQGYYLPAPYCHDLLRTQAKEGKLRAAATQFEPDRYIDSQTFIRLVSGGWIGSRSKASQKLARKLGAYLRESHVGEATLALEINELQ